MPVPTLLAQSVAESIIGCVVTTDGNAALRASVGLLTAVTPTKLDAALQQLEAEPVPEHRGIVS